jgi:arylamine N-acetyltransferase
VHLFERYLHALSVPQRSPSLDALTELTAAHLARIPFENVSKLYYRHDPSRRGLPDLERFLDGVERYQFGGTCYSNNFHLHQLLVHLGYHVMLCGADMAAPNVHMVNLVALDRRHYLVDAGYGAPLLEPLPLDGSGDREVVWGPCRYVLRPRDIRGRSRLDMYQDGVLTHGYTVTPACRRIDEFADVIAASFTGRATFMHALLIARFGPSRSAMLRNLTLARVEGSTWRVGEILGRDDLPEAIEREFGIPLDIARQALDGVQLTRQP